MSVFEIRSNKTKLIMLTNIFICISVLLTVISAALFIYQREKPGVPGGEKKFEFGLYGSIFGAISLMLLLIFKTFYSESPPEEQISQRLIEEKFTQINNRLGEIVAAYNLAMTNQTAELDAKFNQRFADLLTALAAQQTSSPPQVVQSQQLPSPANPPQTEHPDSLELEVFFLFLCLFKTSEGVW
jgi:hypothetical protein